MFQYIPSAKRKQTGTAGAASAATNGIRSITHSDIGRAEFSYATLRENCTYLPEFICKRNDRSIFNAIVNDLETKDPVRWNYHYKYEDPQFSPTFNDVVDKLAAHFNMRICKTRLNYYADGSDYKTFHRDSHIGDENYTIGASFGDSRELMFKHEKTGKTFSFDQHNGDVFAFSSTLNKDFLHGVPRARRNTGSRISIIVWGVI